MNGESDERMTFATALRAAIAERGVTLTWLHRQLHEHANPVAMATLSYWRSGARQPEGASSLAAVEDIEALLGQTHGHLSSLVRSVPRIGPTLETKLPYEAQELVQAIEESIQTLGTVPQSGLRDLSTLVVGYVDANGDLKSTTTRSLIQSTETTVHSVALFDVLSSPQDAPRVMTGVIGGRFAPTYHHPGGLVVCDLLELTEPVPVGGTTMIEFSEEVSLGMGCRELTHTTSRPSKQTMLWVHFHPDAIPDWCEEYTETDDGETAQWRAVTGTAVHAFRFGFGPATLGLRWGFASE